MGMNSEIDVAGFINGYMTAMKEMGKSVNKEHLKAIALEYMDEEDNQYYASVMQIPLKRNSRSASAARPFRFERREAPLG